MGTLARSSSYLVLAAALLAAGCSSSDTVFDTGGIDPSGQWTLTQTAQATQCESVPGAASGEAQPDGMDQLVPPPDDFDVTIRVGAGGRIEILRESTLHLLGDDPSLFNAIGGGCEIMFQGGMDGNRAWTLSKDVNMFVGGREGERFPGPTLCASTRTTTTELTFAETSFTGITETVVTDCDSTCTSRVLWEATRCDSCAPIEDCPAFGAVPGGSRARSTYP